MSDISFSYKTLVFIFHFSVLSKFSRYFLKLSKSHNPRQRTAIIPSLEINYVRYISIANIPWNRLAFEIIKSISNRLSFLLFIQMGVIILMLENSEVRLGEARSE